MRELIQKLNNVTHVIHSALPCTVSASFKTGFPHHCGMLGSNNQGQMDLNSHLWGENISFFYPSELPSAQINLRHMLTSEPIRGARRLRPISSNGERSGTPKLCSQKFGDPSRSRGRKEMNAWRVGGEGKQKAHCHHQSLMETLQFTSESLATLQCFPIEYCMALTV